MEKFCKIFWKKLKCIKQKNKFNVNKKPDYKNESLFLNVATFSASLTDLRQAAPLLWYIVLVGFSIDSGNSEQAGARGPRRSQGFVRQQQI